jgi:YidC/Oxa1 family membrane protein insertase
MVLTTWYQQKQMQTTASSGTQAQQMQMMGRIMPLFLGVFSYSIPAGVVMYWVTTNAWQIGQQQLMLPQKPQDEVESRPAPKSSGGRSKGSSKSSRTTGSRRNAGSRKKRPKR